MAAPSVTMLDVVAAEQRPLRKGILMAMFTVGLPSLAEQLPVETALALSQQTVRVADMGTPSTRNVGQAVAAYNAQFTNGQETLKIIENYISIDKVQMAQKTYVQDPVTMQTTAYGEVVKLTANNLLVAGNPGSDVTQPAGYDYRLRNDAMFLNQSVDAAGRNVQDSTNATTAYAFMDDIDSALVRTRNKADIIVCNQQTWKRLRSILRAQKLWMTTKDQFDRDIDMYRDSKIIDAGVTPAGALLGYSANQIIPLNTSTSLAGTANTTPIYFLVSGGDEGVKLLQLHPLKVTPIGLNPADPGQYVVDVTWPIGQITPTKFCLATLSGTII